ncbi:MAG: hypothetical protein D4R65_02510 [Verrucomicrobiaceae bacterium]|nr:MAG: hypothetical protein D4R65_02510 [Verrucomicrobiaceae bacterium]
MHRVSARFVFSGFSAFTWAVIAFVLLLIPINGDSLDMLESQTWDYARHDSFPAFCNELRTDQNMESSMPLGMFSFWAWARVVGVGAMRSLNLLWAAIALAAFARAGRRLSIPWLPMLFAIQPFLWYYMNYSRTPVMQFAGGALLLAGVIDCLQAGVPANPPGSSSCAPNNGGGLLLCLGAILLSGASIHGLIPLAAVAAGLSVNGAWNRVQRRRKDKVILFVTVGILAILCLYYILRLLHLGYGGGLWLVSPVNVVFVAYEFLGFQGLGLGRQVLRTVMKGSSAPRELLPFLPGLVLFAVAYFAIFAAAMKSWLTREIPVSLSPDRVPKASPRAGLLRAWTMGMGVPLLSALFLFLLAVAEGFPFWGRHLAGAFPFWVVALAITLRWARQGLWRRSGRMGALGVLALLCISSLLIRFAPLHRHDDYRGGAAEARRIASAGRSVWWVADHSGGVYYGLNIADHSPAAPGEIEYAMNRMHPPENPPDAIVISRPDNFDTFGVASRMVSGGAYTRTKRLQAFEIWEKTETAR